MTTEIKRLQFLDGLVINTPTQSAETIYTPVLVSTTPYTATVDETVIYVDTTIGNITINLPSASSPTIVNKFYIIKKITNDANKVIVDPNGSQTIDGSLTEDVEFFNDCLQIHSDGSNWKIISQNIFSNQAFTADFVQSNTSLINNASFTVGVGGGDCSIEMASFNGDPLSGANYATIVFHGSANASGVQNRRKVTANLSLTIPSGATLGFLSGDETPFYIYAIDTGSGVVLGVSRLQLNDNEVYSSTAISNAADLSYVLYSTNAQTSKPIRLLAKVISTQATAGTWASAPTKIYINNGDILPEKVVEDWASNASDTNANASTFIFEDKVKSSHGWYNPSTGEFTVNALGNMRGVLKVKGHYRSNTVGGTFIGCFLVKNGSQIKTLTYTEKSSSQFWLEFSGDAIAAVGDIFTIVVTHDVGAPITKNANTRDNWITWTLE